MYLEGKVYKDGKFWIAECESLDAMTQGRSKVEAIGMLKDWIQSALEDSEFDVEVVERAKSGNLAIAPTRAQPLIALMLQRTREKKGISVRELAKALGFKSHNSYAQYESGKSEPSVSQLDRFLKAIQPNGYRVKIG